MEKIYDFNIHFEMRKMLQEFAESNFMFMGDFNYRNRSINWGSNFGKDVLQWIQKYLWVAFRTCF